ncbi:MAG TPA: hypothetical protein VKA08_02650 [Balneolales bacterium]|nr:hypothetical protein [Balneolales bacterium]
MKNPTIKGSDKKRVYLQFPLRKSRFDPKIMKIFYVFLGLFWIVSGIWFYMLKPETTISWPIVYGSIGILILILANYYEALFSGKYIDYSPDGMVVKLGYNKAIFLEWQQVDEVRLEGKQFSILKKDGERHEWKINKNAMYNWSGFFNALKENLSKRDVSFTL